MHTHTHTHTHTSSHTHSDTHFIIHIYICIYVYLFVRCHGPSSTRILWSRGRALRGVRHSWALRVLDLRSPSSTRVLCISRLRLLQSVSLNSFFFSFSFFSRSSKGLGDWDAAVADYSRAIALWGGGDLVFPTCFCLELCLVYGPCCWRKIPVFGVGGYIFILYVYMLYIIFVCMFIYIYMYVCIYITF
jgi:hypothetical protein